jgi:hypothetical protein
MRAWHRGQRERRSAAMRAQRPGKDARHWNADDQGTSGVILFTFGGFARSNWRARVRRTQSAAVLRALQARCWHAAARAYLFCSFRKEECCSMRVHTDRKQLDGAAIAFVVITLLTVVAFAILLSRLDAFF